MMTWTTACDVLDLASTHDVDEVRPAFLRAVRRTHPDQTGTSESESAFIRVIEANERLTTHRETNDRPRVETGHAAAPRSMESLLGELFACIIEMAVGRKQNGFVRPTFARWDADGIAYVEWSTVEWSGMTRCSESYTFTFEIGDEPESYRELVRILGEPILAKNAAWRERHPEVCEPAVSS